MTPDGDADPTMGTKVVGEGAPLFEQVDRRGSPAPVGQQQSRAPLGGQELGQVPPEWGEGAALARGSNVWGTIAGQAILQPDALAVVCEGEQLTYGQLARRATQLTRYLRSRGVRPEIPVGVCLERSVDQVVALLGVIGAGGVYVPLDPEAPDERIRYVVQDSGMPLLLTQQLLQPKLENAGTETLSLERASDSAAGGVGSVGHVGSAGGAVEPVVPPADGQLAYIIYTSGTTGKPKGVMVEWGSLAAHSQAMVEQYCLSPRDRVLQFSQYSFDASLEQIVPTLIAGGRVVMRGPAVWSPRQLLEEIRGQAVTVMNLPPAYWQQVVREWARTPKELAGVSLRLIIAGGDRLGIEAVENWRRLGLPDTRLLNAYGPTEATITATLAEVRPDTDQVTIGRPLPGRRVSILDRSGRQVPAGALGELHIGGPLLARGYLNQPGLTDERFVIDPLAGRLYRTGDLVRYLADGAIEYVGREDHQVKIRGHRVELAEVEVALEQHRSVEEAVVVSHSHDSEQELVAYVVPAGGWDDGELRQHLRDKLPSYMHPAVIVPLESMPRLPTGKPDRRALPDVERRTRRTSAEYLAPRTSSERQLVRIWEELLDVRPIGIRDNFFDLGGQSLLAVQLLERIETTYSRRLRLSTLFAQPTIEALAEALGESDGDTAGSARVVAVQAGGNRRPFFFLHGDWTGGAFYCFALARACGRDQPFYALEPYAFSADEMTPTLEAVAAAHIGAARTVQPHGPYRLGGFCNGGLLAYEMARQLEAAGEETELLVLISPSPPNQSSALHALCERAARILRLEGKRRADLYLWARHAQRHLYRHLFPSGRRVQDFGKLLDIEPRLGSMFPPRTALYKDYVGVFNWIVAGRPTLAYGGRINFWWGQEDVGGARAWQSALRHGQAGDVQEYWAPGALSSAADQAEQIADVLNNVLSRVEAEQHVVRQHQRTEAGT